MVTDTALMRDATYHTDDDVAEHLDFDRMARVTRGLIAVIGALADEAVR